MRAGSLVFPRRVSLVAAATVALALGLSSPAQAVVEPGHLAGHDRLERYDAGSLRHGRSINFNRVPRSANRAWTRLEQDFGASWALWDASTNVPLRILGAGIEAPGSVHHAASAKRQAERFLQAHLDLLAPGSTWSDFVLVSNQVDGVTGREIRSVGFAQMANGVPVVGGQLSVRFKHDRLVMVASEAIPRRPATLQSAVSSWSAGSLESAARDWVTRDIVGQVTEVQAGPTAVYLPLVDDSGVQALRHVVPVVVRLGQPDSAWTVYVDAARGVPVAREQTLRFADAAVHFDVPVRGPHAAREEVPAARLSLTVDGSPFTSDPGGLVTVAGGGSDLVLGVEGERVAVSTQVGGPASFSINSNGSAPVVWSAANDEYVDAELTTYVTTENVKEYVQQIGSAGQLSWIDEQMSARVNLSQTCNAFYNNGQINFYVEGEGCANTGRLTDVIRHEFGHAIHDNSIIEGVGLFEGALSEGISDYLAATIADDSGMGRGFRLDDDPLRELDPDDLEWSWPEHRGEVHNEGRIIGGTLWDLREAMIAAHGQQEGVARTDEIWFEATRRAVDIPSMFPEALLVDDDDGDLTNGTPNGCMITDVFGAHGLYLPRVDIDAPGQVLALHDGYEISAAMDLQPLPDCGVNSTATLEWRLRDELGTGGVVDMTLKTNTFQATIPPVPEGSVVQYRIEITHDNGSVQALPINETDNWYEMFVGRVEEIYCTDFETDPRLEGWTSDGNGGDDDEWDWGAPLGEANDPDQAYSGTSVWGQDLGGDDSNGAYRGGSWSWTISPPIDVSGYDQVRLQYQRWLEVEDGAFDQARIILDSESVWENFASPDQDDASAHHRDGEWRFQDVDLTPSAGDGQVQLAWDLRSDQGLHMGGWTLDDVCVVGYVGGTVCGDGVLEVGEACDDGNNIDGDGCDANCGDGDGDGDGDDDGDGDGDAGDDGMDDDDDGETGDAGAMNDDGGCACDVDVDEQSPAGPGLALLGLLGLVGVRRRRRG